MMNDASGKDKYHGRGGKVKQMERSAGANATFCRREKEVEVAETELISGESERRPAAAAEWR